MEFDRRHLLQAGLLAATTAPLMGFTPRPTEFPEAMTVHGPVRGVSDSNVAVFKGIRYGEDTRLTRFAKPRSPKPWAEPAQATDYGTASPQSGDDETISEDCLFLNVWTPGVADGGKRPVMVYFHGGAYAAGSGSAPVYDGKALASQGDVVVITVNHRLNAFGYLSLGLLNGAFADAGNAGMWDLVLALNWVRDNVEAFGGDPSRVFLFGQSGGGAKIATLMAAPSAKGLFHSCATMSGQQVTACGPLNGKARALAYLDKIGIEASDTETLRSAPMERLIEGLSARDPINEMQGLYFGPVMDGRFLSRHPFWPDAPGQSSAIPMILGNTHDETRNLIGRSDPTTFDLDWADVAPLLAVHMRCDIDPAEVVATYRDIYPDYTPSDVFFAAATAGRSWRGQVEEADARAREAGPTWVYQFDFPSPEEDGKYGAPHAIDIAYAFNNLALSGIYPGTKASVTPRSQTIADQLSSAFINMARQGDPNHSGLTTWDRHTLPDRETMVFGQETALINDPRRAERELFAKVPFTQWGT